MQISRRDLFRSTAAVAAGGIVLGRLGLADAAVAGPATRRAPVAVLGNTTRTAVLERGTAGAGGYAKVVALAGEKSVLRAEVGAKAKSGRVARRSAVLAFGQMSDVHICDAESPNRVENGDNFSSSAWRPGEGLGLHVAEAMVQQINAIGMGPVTKRPLDLVVQTGDNADNAQYNEVRWNIDVLDGGEVRHDSGDPDQYEGVMTSVSAAYYNPRYWHPEGQPEGQPVDDYRANFGFPEIPGMLEAARRPFQATGLSTPWITALGNHDPLIQGNEVPTASDLSIATGNRKTFIPGQTPKPVTADPNRRQLSTQEIVEEHFNLVEGAPGPVGHGYTEENRAEGTGYYTFDHGDLVRFIVMDTVNHNGDDKGCLNETEFAWIKAQLAASKDKLVIFASHHTSWTMNSTATGDVDPGPRISGKQLVKLMLAHPNVIAWVNGHTHRNNILAHQKTKKVKRKGKKVTKVVGGFWEINTASHIDWPQQARLIEVADNRDGTLSIFTTMLDHAAPTEYSDLESPLELAALGRELALNDPQERNDNRRGKPKYRNTELIVKAPAFLR